MVSNIRSSARNFLSGKWYNYIDEDTIADAIMDRLSANALRFELKGESLRKKKSEKFD
jgi:DNA replication protein DnaC